MKADYHICTNGRRSYSYFQVQKDTASIRGWLPFEVCVFAHYCPHKASQVDEASVSTALYMGTMSTRQCGLSFWERLRRLERLSATTLLLTILGGIVITISLNMASNVLFFRISTVAAAIPIRAVEPQSLLCPWQLYECYHLFESSYYFASLFVACNVNSRAATKRVAASVPTNMVPEVTPSPHLLQPNVPLRPHRHCFHYIMLTVSPSKGTSEATIGMSWAYC